MQIIKHYTELTEEFKFEFKGSCFCNGTETHKYKGPNMLKLEVRKHGGTFRLFTPDKILTNRWEKLIYLESYLKKYGILEVLAAEKIANKN